MVDDFNPNLWENETLYLFFLLSTIPSYILSLLQFIFATKLLFKSKRNTKNVYQLRYILLFSVTVEIMNLIIDEYYFPDAMLWDAFALVYVVIWTLYFFKSYRAKYVLAEWPGKWDYQAFQSGVKPIGSDNSEEHTVKEPQDEPDKASNKSDIHIHPKEEQQENKLKTAQHKGMKRLAIFLSVLSFVVSYALLIIFEQRVNDEEMMIEFPLISLVIAITVWCLVRGVYWVIDGFKSR